MAKYFVSKTEVLIVDGRIVGYETPLTLCKHTTKRYSKLIREYNKRRKEVKLTVADIAQMTELAEAEDKNG